MSQINDSTQYNTSVNNSTQYDISVNDSTQYSIAEQSQEARLISPTQDDLQKARLDDDAYQSTPESTRESWNSPGATSRHD
ncbi:unnamed protein product [Adineta steineri]|uniref:Uncharacterized protein n=1 Tax=Adineta steineri TaxID=433720 RepID=A0A819BHY0_9BILA|nr:unnamed protein product [Adineta steineri]CAF3792653.1 unnamed protein product [Adineta steineri]